MYHLRSMPRTRVNPLAVLLGTLVALTPLTGCKSQPQDLGESAGFAMTGTSNCFPDTTLLDQHGQPVSLSSLKGKPALFDFIYTTCPGECLLLTQRMKQVAKRLGPAVGSDIRLISVTVDPEHDHSPELLTYADNQGASMNGWLFLTGTPEQIDDLMAHFDLIRKHEANGTVDHVPEFFLVDANGRALLQYVGDKADPERIASDLQEAAAGKPVLTADGTNVAASN